MICHLTFNPQTVRLLKEKRIKPVYIVSSDTLSLDPLVTILEAGLASIFSIASNLIKIIFGILVSIYVLVDKERFIHQGKLLSFMILKKDRGRRFVNIVKVYHKMIGMYIGAKAIDSIIIGLLSFLGLLVLGAPYPYLIAIIVVKNYQKRSMISKMNIHMI